MSKNKTKDDVVRPNAAYMVHETVLNMINDIFGGQNTKKLKVLDAACGKGSLSLNLAKRFPGSIIEAVDISPPKNIDNKQINCRKIDLDKGLYNYEDNYFDISVSIETIEHLWNPFLFLKELIRVTALGGHIFLTTPNAESIYSKLYFLFKNRFLWFKDENYIKDRHVQPIFKWQLLRFAELQGIELIKHTFNRGYVPKMHFLTIPSNSAFGEIHIFCFKKIFCSLYDDV